METEEAAAIWDGGAVAAAPDAAHCAGHEIERLTAEVEQLRLRMATVRALALEWVHLGATLEDHADIMPGPQVRTVARSQMAMDHGWAIIKALAATP
jgi:hypothetical protein